MNNVEKRSTYAVGLYLHFLSYGNPLSPSKLEEFWLKLFQQKKLNFRDKNNNKYSLVLISEQDADMGDFDYAVFLSYLEDLNLYLKTEWVNVATNLITNNCRVDMVLSNHIEVRITDNSGKEILNHTINFLTKEGFSITVGKKDLYVDGGYSKNVKFLDSIFGKTEFPLQIYRDFRSIQDRSGYYDSVKFLYDFYTEEYKSKMDDPSYISDLWNILFYLSMDSVINKTGDLIRPDNSRVHFNKESSLSLGLYFETTNDKTPILKVKCTYCEPDIFKIRTKREKYKEDFRYKTYLEIGKGFELFTV